MARNRDTSLAATVVDLLQDPVWSVPEDWLINWADEPYRFKLYEDPRSFPLPNIIPLFFGNHFANPLPQYSDETPNDLLTRLSHLLIYVAGLFENRHEIEPVADPTSASDPPTPVHIPDDRMITLGPSSRAFFRAVPSGGALYPWEIYILTRGDSSVPAGVYHYDTAHHALVVIREGDMWQHLSHALPDQTGASPDFALFISVRFWKNFFKYGHTSLRLHGLDSGALMSRLNWLACGFGFASNLFFRFRDAAIADLLGLERAHEAVMAVNLLRGLDRPPTDPLDMGTGVPAAKLPTIREKIRERSRAPKCSALARELAYFSEIDSEEEFTRVQQVAEPALQEWHDGPITVLPEPTTEACDVGKTLRVRRSGIDHVRKRDISLSQVHALCDFAMRAYPHDLFNNSQIVSHTALAIAASRVDDLPQGIYLFDALQHQVRNIVRGYDAQALQNCYHPRNLNFAAASAIFFVLGNYDRTLNMLGNRGFRILNMEAGIVMERLYTRAGLLGLGVHAFIGYHSRHVRRMLRLDETPLMPLVAVAIGAPKTSRVSLRLPLWV